MTSFLLLWLTVFTLPPVGDTQLLFFDDAVPPPPPPPVPKTNWPVIVEAENFTVTPKYSMNVTSWGGDHLYGATFSNTFASRKALLHATASSVGTAVSPSVSIPTAGTWYVCVRYEAAYRFETEFTLNMKQNGASKLSKLYGQRTSNKIWPFGWSLKNHEIAGCGANPTPECHWTWGATENWVWEFYPVSLSVGSASFEIEVNNVTSKPGLAALTDRNIDAILLTQNLTDIQIRMVNEQQLALDGLFTQHDEVFMKVTNLGTEDMQLVIPFSAYHSAYPSQHLICIPYCKASANGAVYSSIPNIVIEVPKQTTTPTWVEVGSRMDSFNDGTWDFHAIPAKKTPETSETYETDETYETSRFVTLVPPGTNHSSPTDGGDVGGGGGGGDGVGDTSLTSSSLQSLLIAPPKPPPPPPPPPFVADYSIEFGVKTGGAVKSIAVFKSNGPDLQVAFDANTVATHRIRVVDASLPEALAEAKDGVVPTGSKPASLTPIFGYTFCKSSSIRDIEPACFLENAVSSSFDANLKEFLEIFPISDTSLPVFEGDRARKRVYFEARALIHNLTSLEILLQNFSASGIADDILVVSLGDEISLSVPSNAATAQAAFVAWCTANHVSVPGQYNTTYAGNAKLFWYSNRFSNDYGLTAMSGATTLLRKYLKNAGVGANYSPLTYSAGGYVDPAYFYPVNKAITMFRTGSMTLPWGEDYTWQSPIGTQQMTGVLLDLFRAGIRNSKEPQTSNIMFYAMAHAPGNTATSWRRNFYNYLAHGIKYLNLYEFRPCTASYTENYVDTGYGIYSSVRTALAELSSFEDIIQAGSVVSGNVGLWCSDAFDIWAPATPPTLFGQHHNTFLAGKRALYIMALHMELALDMVVEDDLGATLNSYKVILLSDTHVSVAASHALATWVNEGGTLIATAGGGMYDELNTSNTVLQQLLGVTPVAMYEPADSSIQYIKQDLRFAKVLTTVGWNNTASCISSNESCSVDVIGALAMYKSSVGGDVLARFGDGSDAVVTRVVGKGSATYFGFMPGLAYFKPAIPLRPTDRGGTDAAFTHFVPWNFSQPMLEIFSKLNVTTHAPTQVNCSNHLVHGRVVSAAGKGVVIPLTNWGSSNITNLTVTVNAQFLHAGVKASLASGNKVVETEPAGSFFIETFSVADALILR